IMKDRLNISRARDHDPITGQPVMDRFSPEKSPPAVHGTTKYSKLKNQTDSPNRQFVQSPIQIDSPNRQFTFSPIYNHSSMTRHLNDDLLEINDNSRTLKTVSRQIDSEFDERQVMLDEFNNEMEIITDSKLDSTIKKMAKVLHISNGNYNNYTPAPTTSKSNASDYIPRPCSLSSLSNTIYNCFICSKD
ncbi:hypothetical protein QAD02_006847, partial [Eretmocerus hayati]